MSLPALAARTFGGRTADNLTSARRGATNSALFNAVVLDLEP